MAEAAALRQSLQPSPSTQLTSVTPAVSSAAYAPPRDSASEVVGASTERDLEPGRSETSRGEEFEIRPRRGLANKLVSWLGKLHPASIHFPIALLTAAALAEGLHIATRTASFGAIVRYCLWVGALTAMVAAILGSFLAGPPLTDASGIMMAHRWLGIATVAGAGCALALNEVSRLPHRHRARLWFRITLLGLTRLVLATGVLGGAVVLGLNHYLWPA
jgi:uncharacterized membrane protein